MSQSPLQTSVDSEEGAYEAAWASINKLIREGGSFSGRERNCCYLNTGSTRFADVSAVSGLDFSDDARALATVDWDEDGDADLWLLNRTGPRLRFMRNDAAPQNHFLSVRLIGMQCNKDAIGARIELQVGNETLIRSLRAGDGYLSQSSKTITIGLGNHTAIERLMIRWPGGDSESIQPPEVDQHYEIVQGSGRADLRERTGRSIQLSASTLEPSTESGRGRVAIIDPVPVPSITYVDFEGQDRVLHQEFPGPVLVNFWASWCRPCLGELTEFSERATDIRDSGVGVVALCVNGLTEGDDSTIDDAIAFLDKLNVSFQTGLCTSEVLDTTKILQDVLTSPSDRTEQLPISILIDEFGRVAVIYQGVVPVDDLLADVQMLKTRSADLSSYAFPFPGRWMGQPYSVAEVLAELAEKFAEHRQFDAARQYANAVTDWAGRVRIRRSEKDKLADLFGNLGYEAILANDLRTAVRDFQQSLLVRPDSAEVHANLGIVLSELGDDQTALKHLLTALSGNPNLHQARVAAGRIYLNGRNPEEAARHLSEAVRIDPAIAAGHLWLGVAAARLGDQSQALKHLNEAVRLAPNDEESRQKLNSVMAGRLP